MKLNKWLVNDITAQAYKDGKADGRAEVIEEIKKYVYRNIHFYDAIEQLDFYNYLEKLKEKN